MDKDLEIITRELLETLEIENSITKVENTSDIHFYISSEETLNSYKKYGKYDIVDIVRLVRIERLFDLHYINERERESLVRAYHDYKILDNVIGTLELDVLFKESEVDLSKDDYYEMSAKREKLAGELQRYGIIEPFNYYDAFMNQIDSEIRGMKKEKNNSK